MPEHSVIVQRVSRVGALDKETATIANAIHSATGIRLKELPMTTVAIFQAIQEQDKAG